MGSDVTTRRRRKMEILLLLCLLCAGIAVLVVGSGPGSLFGSGDKGAVLVATGTGAGSAAFASTNGASNGNKGSGVPGVADSIGNGNIDPTSGCNSNGNCNGLPKDFGVSVGSVQGLSPGFSTTIPVRYTNPYSFAVSVIAASASVQGSAACPGSYVDAGSYASTSGVPVARNGSADASLPIRLKPAAPDACQGVQFTITVTAQAVKS